MATTQGEWRYRKQYQPEGFGFETTRIAHGITDIHAHMFTVVGVGATEERLRLIAAAPDLLAACKDGIAFLTDIQSRHHSSGFHNERVFADASDGIEILNDAIAKAEAQK